MTPTWEPSPYIRYRYMAIFGLIILGTALGCFYLGAHMTTENTNVMEQAIYDHGYTVGYAAGINQGNTQCGSSLRSLIANCNSWETAPERLGINLAAGGT